MILTAHQPVYLPWLGLFHKIALADLFISFDQVQYLPKDWNNRNRIKTSTGPVWLTVPVLRHGHRERPLSELEINNALPWGRKHWRTLDLNYRHAPYFREYAPFFEETYARRWSTLAELNGHMLDWLLRILGITTPVRSMGELHVEGRKSDLVLNMCLAVGAAVYVFGEQGRSYADIGAFRRNGVEPVFQDYRHPVYPQQHGEFISHLSVVDLLFNCGPRSLGVILSGNTAKADLLAHQTQGRV